jgi:Lrp/AsnC family transcriptional regulator, leucine-responsive regulatory protein
VPLDEFDRRLLDALQHDSRRTGEQLAELVGLSPAACLRRAQRLRETGVIEREVAILSPAAVGRHIMLTIFVTLEGDQPGTSDTFKRRMERAPEVMQCYSITGAVDFVLIVTLAEMDDYNALAARLFSKNVKRWETSIVLDRVKFETALPIGDGSQS